MRYFATLFDSNYLDKGLALHSSLKSHLTEFKLFVLCLDDIAFDYLTTLRLTTIHPIKLDDVEREDEKLRIAKGNRGKVEYYFTLSPVLPSYILNHFEEVDTITTLDADIYFFSDPGPIFDEFEGNSVLITPHRFPEKLKDKRIYGMYNVSFQMFRRDANGLSCLSWWKEKCIEWCYDRLEGDRFADQKYLDDWLQRFPGVKVLAHEGAGLAPWNIDNYKISWRNGKVYSNNVPLIFYHFHYLKPIKDRWFTHGVDLYYNRMTPGLKNLVYHPYIAALIQNQKEIKIMETDQHLRTNSARKPVNGIDIIRNYATLYNVSSHFTIGINLKRFFN